MRRVFLASSPLCAVCGVMPAVELDHVVPVSDGGAFWAGGNLQGLCRGCHRVKTAGERRGRRGFVPASSRYLPSSELEGDLD